MHCEPPGNIGQDPDLCGSACVCRRNASGSEHLCNNVVEADNVVAVNVVAEVCAGLQYAAAVHGEKLKRVWHRAANSDCPAGQTIGKQFFNPRGGNTLALAESLLAVAGRPGSLVVRASDQMRAYSIVSENSHFPQVSDQLTGFQHNAVSPIGLATDLPIIMSDRVAALQPPVFWLGGGEPDLK